MKGFRKIGLVLLKVLGVLLTLALLAAACFSLVLAQPQPGDKKAEPESRPLQSPGSAMNIDTENDLRELVAAFPIPVMSFMSGSGLTFVSATSSDLAYNGGFARIAALYWQTEDGQPLILRSIYPAGALSLLEKDFHFTPVAGPTLFGTTSIRMENGDTIRLHTTTETGLYAVNCPQSLKDRISAIARSLQLFTAGEKEPDSE